jgi:hypothetical protein
MAMAGRGLGASSAACTAVGVNNRAQKSRIDNLVNIETPWLEGQSTVPES